MPRHLPPFISRRRALSLLAGIVLMALSPAVLGAASLAFSQRKLMARITAEADRQEVPAALALAVAEAGSNFSLRAKGPAGQIGVMQVSPYAAARVGVSEWALWTPADNIRAGVRSLAVLLHDYSNVPQALAHYYGGGAETLNGAAGISAVAQRFVEQVLQNRDRYEQLAFDAELVMRQQVENDPSRRHARTAWPGMPYGLHPPRSAWSEW